MTLNRNIIVVEDDPQWTEDIMELCQDALEDLGVNGEVHFARTLQEAQDALSAMHFDFVTVDLNLVGGESRDSSGVKLLEAISKAGESRAGGRETYTMIVSGIGGEYDPRPLQEILDTQRDAFAMYNVVDFVSKVDWDGDLFLNKVKGTLVYADAVELMRNGQLDKATKKWEEALEFAPDLAYPTDLGRAAKQGKGQHPTTALPGGALIDERLKSLVRGQDEDWTLILIRISKLDLFNNWYSFKEGDEVLRFLAQVIQSRLGEVGSGEEFLGHSSNNEFLIITRPNLAKKLTSLISEDFESSITGFFHFEDRERGFIEFEQDGKQRREEVPFMSLEIGVVPPDAGPFADSHQILKQATEAIRDSAKK